MVITKYEHIMGCGICREFSRLQDINYYKNKNNKFNISNTKEIDEHWEKNQDHLIEYGFKHIPTITLNELRKQMDTRIEIHTVT